MKKFILGFLLIITAVFIFTACEKVKDLPYYQNGAAVTLSSSVDAITPTSADSAKNILSLTWTNPHYATDSNKYKFIIQIDSSESFSHIVTKEVMGSLTTFFTGKELNNILLGYGFSLSSPATLHIRVISSYQNNNEQYPSSNVIQVTVTPYADASVLTVTPTEVTCAMATADQNAADFSWTTAFNGYSGDITYTLQYDSAGANFASPHEIAIGTSLYTKSINQGDLNETAISSGVVGGTTGTVEYRIKSSTALGAVAYSNVVNVTIHSYESILRFYMPGSYQTATGNGTDWTPGDAPELIRDQRTGLLNNMYYIYIWLPANAEFKVTQGRAWDIAYGDAGNGTISRSGGNFHVANAGFYRITIDRSALKYDIKVGRMGFVGGAVTGVDWNPSAVFPAAAMSYIGVNQFLGLYNFGTGGWKMIDNDQWNNGSNSVDETRSYGSNGGSGSTLDVNAENMPDIATTGLYRVIWNGTDRDNLKYEIYQGLRVVGGFQGWDPGTAPDMTYQGNGVWKTTITLPAGEFKFVSANGWDFNYGGSNGMLSRNGSNLSVTGGTYTITVDEYSQTYSIQ